MGRTKSLIAGICVVAAICLLGGILYARSPKSPPVSPTTLIGTWEAIAPELPRLVVLRVQGIEPAKVELVMVTGPGSPSVILFRASKVALDAGKLVVKAEGAASNQQFVVELRVSGTAFGSTGQMSGTFQVQLTGDGTSPSRWPILLVKDEDGLVNWLRVAKATAIQALETSGSSIPTPPSGTGGTRSHP